MPTFLSLKDYVYDYISNEIKEGRLQPNQKVYEKQIMNALQISSTPVREAFIELSVVGVLENVPRKGFFVKPVGAKRVVELYQIIGVLDALCASLSLQNLKHEDFIKMETIIQHMDQCIQSVDFQNYYIAQANFHDVYIEKSGNAELNKALKNHKKLFIRQSYEHIDDERLMQILQQTNDEHKEILKLLKSNNSKLLESYIREVHWCSSNSIFDIFD